MTTLREKKSIYTGLPFREKAGLLIVQGGEMPKRKRIIGVLLLMLTMLMSMAGNAFAVSGAIESDRTDYNTNRTGNNTAERQANSSNVGTIRLGKILTVNQSGKFPNIEDFVYKITPVAAWDNANVSTKKSGKIIAQSDMPKPATSSAAHHDIRGVAPDDLDNAPWAALVTVGNFKNASESNTSSIYGDRDHKYVDSDDASNIDKISEGMRRTRTTDVSIRFSKAGYYMYRIEEVGSRRNGENDSLSHLRKDVAGVDYDNNSYYVVFYVCNREATADVNANEYGQGTQKGDTVGQAGYLNKINNDGTQKKEASDSGVYVHTITSWTNQFANDKADKSATDYKPDNTMRSSDELANAQKWINDLQQAQDVDSKYNTGYGDGGHAAKLNTGRADDNNKGMTDSHPAKTNGTNGTAGDRNEGPSTVTHDNLGKVGISTPKDPDFLEAYRMWNAQVVHDVVIKKNVTGNLGDLSKEFVFEVSLEGLEANQTYTTNVPAGSAEDEASALDTGNGSFAGEATNDQTSAAVKMYDMSPASSLSEDGKSFTTDESGKVSFKVNLRDDEILVLNALPRTASYQVKEQASDHVPQYNIVSTNKDQTNKALFTETGHTPGGNDAEHLGTANKDANTELSTKVEYVDRYDGTVTIIFQNDRDLATLTGIAGLDYMVYAAALAVLTVSVMFIVRRRREYAEEDMMA